MLHCAANFFALSQALYRNDLFRAAENEKRSGRAKTTVLSACLQTASSNFRLQPWTGCARNAAGITRRNGLPNGAIEEKAMSARSISVYMLRRVRVSDKYGRDGIAALFHTQDPAC